MSPRSAPRSLGSRPPAPRAARRLAAPASTSAASRPRRCSTRRNISRRRRDGAMAKMGIKVTPELDLDAMHAQRLDAVKGLTGGIEFLFKKNKVEWLKGRASFESADTVKVGDRTVTREEHRHRHRLVGDAAAGRRDRPEARSSIRPARWSCLRCPSTWSSSAAASSGWSSAGCGGGSAPRSPASNSSTRSCPASTATSARKPTRSSRSRASNSSSAPR